MNKVKIKAFKEATATQWDGTDNLSDGKYWFNCEPEVYLSANGLLVYFTFADLMPRHWVSVSTYTEKPDDPCGFFSYPDDNPTEGYYRIVLPFAFWSVKAKSSITKDYRAVYLSEHPELQAVFNDFVKVEEWPNPLPKMVEYREVNGALARGFRPYYLKEGDWLVDWGTEKDRYEVVNHSEFMSKFTLA